MSQALNRMLLNPIMSGLLVVEDDSVDDYEISMY
jgi:hypothetical protein